MAEFLTVVHECTDYARWKPVFDADAANRRAAGLTDLMLVRQQNKPNIIAVVLGVGDRAKAQAMVASPTLRESMAKGGIIGKPEVHFRQGELTVKPASKYLSMNCRIRDLATFRKGYAMDQGDRAAATLTDLGLMTDVADAQDLLLIWSLTDQAKVDALAHSPALAEHQVKNAGLLGPPELRYWLPA